MDRNTDKQSRQIEGWMDRQKKTTKIDRRMDIQTDKQLRQKEFMTDIQTNKYKYKHTDGQTDKQTNLKIDIKNRQIK